MTPDTASNDIYMKRSGGATAWGEVSGQSGSLAGRGQRRKLTASRLESVEISETAGAASMRWEMPPRHDTRTWGSAHESA